MQIESKFVEGFIGEGKKKLIPNLLKFYISTGLINLWNYWQNFIIIQKSLSLQLFNFVINYI